MNNLIKCELGRQLSKKSVTIFIISFFIFIVLCLFNLTFGVGFYDPLVVTPLDGLNFAPFVLRDFHLYLIFILCPLIVVQSFNGEYKTGEYRMVMIRPHSKLKLYTAKFIACVIPLLIFLALSYFMATLIGYLVLPTAPTTLFFYEEFTFNSSQTFLFNGLFYLIEGIILMAVMSVMASVSLVMPNAIVAYMGSLFVIMGIGFSSVKFEFFVSSTKSIFDLILNLGQGGYGIIYILVALCVGSIISIYQFTKRDYLS